jgi:hypothetical protein
VPGSSRFHLLWALYLSLFLTYTFTSADLERAILKDSGFEGVYIAAGVFAAIAIVFWIARKLRLRDLAEVPFEADDPDDLMFQGFHLSEIQAAQAVASKANPPRE